jgi:hypothetical protein
MLLIVTDVAARGIDLPLLDNAINVHFPEKPKLFVHRVGELDLILDFKLFIKVELLVLENRVLRSVWFLATNFHT